MPGRGRGTCVCVLTIRPNGDHLLYHLRYHLDLSPASVERRLQTVDIEEVFALLRSISAQL